MKVVFGGGSGGEWGSQVVWSKGGTTWIHPPPYLFSFFNFHSIWPFFYPISYSHSLPNNGFLSSSSQSEPICLLSVRLATSTRTNLINFGCYFPDFSSLYLGTIKTLNLTCPYVFLRLNSNIDWLWMFVWCWWYLITYSGNKEHFRLYFQFRFQSLGAAANMVHSYSSSSGSIRNDFTDLT